MAEKTAYYDENLRRWECLTWCCFATFLLVFAGYAFLSFKGLLPEWGGSIAFHICVSALIGNGMAMNRVRRIYKSRAGDTKEQIVPVEIQE